MFLHAQALASRSSKSQVPNTKGIPNFNFQIAVSAIGAWVLVLLWDLVVGIWSFLP
jgi:hypothetical protein